MEQPLAMHLACVLCGLSMEEALVAATINAAYAVGCEAHVGSLEVGKNADLIVLRATSYVFLLISIGT